MIAATGLTTSIASAQFKVDYSAKDKTTSETKTESVSVFTDHDGEHSYEIKIVNGEIVVAKIDGQKLSDDRVKMNDDVLIFISEDGEEVHEIKMHNVHKDGWVSDHAMGNLNTNWFSKDGKQRIVVDRSGGSEGEVHSYFMSSDERTPPKVMLGINLGEPSKILRKHLKLKDGVHAILVEGVIKGLPAALSGLEDFDIIISIDGSDQADADILHKVLTEKDAGDNIKLVVLRSGDTIKLKIKLAKYDAKALGGKVIYDDMESYELIKEELEQVEELEERLEFEILTQLERGEFGNNQGFHLTKLKEQLHKQLSGVHEQHEIAIDLRAKAMDAMKDAERQILEFRDGKLLVRRSDERLREHLSRAEGRIRELYVRRDQLGELKDRFPMLNVKPEALHNHMESMNSRLDQLESRFDQQLNQMNHQIDRLAIMFERLMSVLDNNDD